MSFLTTAIASFLEKTGVITNFFMVKKTKTFRASFPTKDFFYMMTQTVSAFYPKIQ